MTTVMDENSLLQEEERMALEAIYGPDAFHTSSSSPGSFQITINVDQDNPELKSPRVLVVHFFLPATYPSTEPPVYEVTSVYCGSHKVDADMLNTIEREFENMFQPGQVVLFEWVSWLRDYLEATIPKPQIQDNVEIVKIPEPSQNKTVEERPEKDEILRNDESVTVPAIYSSPEPLVDRKSVFVAHVAEVHHISEVWAVVAKLLENKKIAKATHNIMAYRIVMPDGRVSQDNDDDGETAAGGRLMHLMQILNVTNVVVVVSRWYGGILLGADRFKDINNCARKALEDCGFIKDDRVQSTTADHKVKTRRKK